MSRLNLNICVLKSIPALMLLVGWASAPVSAQDQSRDRRQGGDQRAEEGGERRSGQGQDNDWREGRGQRGWGGEGGQRGWGGEGGQRGWGGEGGQRGWGGGAPGGEGGRGGWGGPGGGEGGQRGWGGGGPGGGGAGGNWGGGGPGGGGQRGWGGGNPGGGGGWNNGSGGNFGGNRGGGGNQRGGGGGGNQNWNPAEFLKRLDTNGDGRLDPTEVTGRTQGFLQNMGFDTSKPIPLSQVEEKIKAEQGGGGERGSRAAASNREPAAKVPGFGPSNEKVANFGSASSKQLEELFDSSILEQVDWILRSYDRNNDGFVDENEAREVPWGSPSYHESDTDRDGKLSRQELAYRYKAREEFVRRGEGANTSSQNEASRGDPANRGNFSTEPGRSVAGSSRSSSGSSARSRSSASGSSTPTVSPSGYVDNMFEKFDKDRDGVISAEEAKEIRNPPPLNNDGVITKEEYTKFISGDSSDSDSSSSGGSASGSASGSGSTSASGSERSTRRGNSSENTRRGDSRSSSRSKSSFEDYDENKNGMIEMHEFAEDWDDEVLKRFYEKDKNGDGVITRNEWSSR